MRKETLKRYLTGRFSKKELTHYYMPLMLSIIIICIVISYLSFPPELNYSIFERTISNLGSRDDSPYGWYFLSIGMISWGVLMIPLFLYYHRRIRQISKHGARTGTIFGFIGCIFVILIGFFTDDRSILIFGIEMRTIHVIIAIIGIGGIALGLMSYSIPIQVDHFSKRGHKQFNGKLVFLGYSLIYSGGIGAIIAEIIKEIQGINDFPGPGFLSFSFYEWIWMLTFYAFIAISCFFIPEEVKMLKDKQK